MNITKFGVHIKCKDITKSYNFYSKFGLKPVFCYGRKKWLRIIKDDFGNVPNSDFQYDGVIFNIGESVLEIANGHVSVKPEVFLEDITSSKVSAMINVDSINRVVQICETNKFKISVQPKIYPWGTKELVIRTQMGLY